VHIGKRYKSPAPVETLPGLLPQGHQAPVQDNCHRVCYFRVFALGFAIPTTSVGSWRGDDVISRIDKVNLAGDAA